MNVRPTLLVLALLALLTAPLTAAAGAAVGCHQAAVVGPAALGVDAGGFAALAAEGELVLADGTVLAHGSPVLPGQEIRSGVVRNVGAQAVGVSFGDRDPVVLDPGTTAVVGSATAVENERICVCECYCGGGTDKVQIRCDSNTDDCSQLNGSICELDDGEEAELEECVKKFVKPADATAEPTGTV